MKTLAHHIEHVRGQPMHIRKQVAFALALGATGLVALLWLAVSLSTGAFHIQDTSFAEAQQGTPVASAPAQNTSLLGAAAAALSGGSSTPASLEVVGAATTSAPAVDSRTAIPF